MQENIYIVGHRNPDVDSVCSALGYAAYKAATGNANYKAARCGISNARIDRILKKFKAPLPEYLGDVRLRAQHVMRRDFLSLPKDVSCYAVMDMIDRYDLRSVPLLDSAGKMLGEVSVFDLGEFFIPRPRSPREARRVRATLNDVIKTLDAEAPAVFRADEMEDMFVRIGAMEVSSFGSFIDKEQLRPEQNLIVVGDRFDIQIKAVQMGVRGIIITGGYPVDAAVLEMARQKSVSVISCKHDSATTALLVRMATRAEPLMRRDFSSVRREALLSGIALKKKEFSGGTIFVCSREGKLEGVFSRTDLIDPPRRKLVLVDHNELSQAVTGAEEAEILEIIDHHRVGGAQTVNPILFINKPVGATCTIVSEFFMRDGLRPDKRTAGLLLGGIVCDTLNLKSPTATSADAEQMRRLEKISGVNASELADYVFGADSVILSSPPSQTVLADCKFYENDGVKFSVSQVEELGFDNFFSKFRELKDALEKLRKDRALLFSALLVTNVIKQDSLLLICGDENFVSKIGYAWDSERGVFELPGIVSRKKQLVPYLSGLLKDF